MHQLLPPLSIRQKCVRIDSRRRCVIVKDAKQRNKYNHTKPKYATIHKLPITWQKVKSKIYSWPIHLSFLEAEKNEDNIIICSINWDTTHRNNFIASIGRFRSAITRTIGVSITGCSQKLIIFGQITQTNDRYESFKNVGYVLFITFLKAKYEAKWGRKEKQERLKST